MAGFEVIGAEELQEIQEVLTLVLFIQTVLKPCETDALKYKNLKSLLPTIWVRNTLLQLAQVLLPCTGVEARYWAWGRSHYSKLAFVATVEAIVESGATPICGEIDDSLNLDPNNLEQLITSKTKAVIVVHAWVPANLPRIIEICENNVRLIEDTAYRCGGKLNGKH